VAPNTTATASRSQPIFLVTGASACAPSAARLARTARIAAGALSTNVASAAPRDSASMPSAPEPANKSSTRAPATRSPRIENSASRMRSDVGRVAVPVGAVRRRPRH
jgi:hypothetical protein